MHTVRHPTPLGARRCSIIPILHHCKHHPCTLVRLARQVENAVAVRAAYRQKLEASKGPTDQQEIEDKVQAFKQKQQAKEDKEFGFTPNFCELGGLDYFFIRFANHYVQVRPAAGACKTGGGAVEGTAFSSSYTIASLFFLPACFHRWQDARVATNRGCPKKVSSSLRGSTAFTVGLCIPSSLHISHELYTGPVLRKAHPTFLACFNSCSHWSQGEGGLG